VLSSFVFLYLYVQSFSALAAPVPVPCSAVHCWTLKKTFKEAQRKKEQMKAILGKNQEYLDKHPNASASIQIKVNSNITIAMLSLRTQESEEEVIRIEVKKCPGCGPI
jgi:hypothetical protein